MHVRRFSLLGVRDRTTSRVTVVVEVVFNKALFVYAICTLKQPPRATVWAPVYRGFDWSTCRAATEASEDLFGVSTFKLALYALLQGKP